MKHFILLLLLAVSSLANAKGMLDEGNVWSYKTLGYSVWQSDLLVEVTFMKYFIDGECEKNGKTYKKIWRQDARYNTFNYEYDESYVTYSGVNFYACAREENGKVYIPTEDLIRIVGDEMVLSYFYENWYWCERYDDEYLVFDFNIEQPLIASHWLHPYIGYDEGLFCTDINSPIDAVRRTTTLNLFYRNGEQEYIADDYYPDPFFPEVTTAISAPAENMAQQGNAIFTIQGTRLTAPQKGLNIINGKKVMIR